MMSILHQRKDTGELHVMDPVYLLEIPGLHVLYISLIRRTRPIFKTLEIRNNPEIMSSKETHWCS